MKLPKIIWLLPFVADKANAQFNTTSGDYEDYDIARNFDNDPEKTVLGPAVSWSRNKLFNKISVSTQASTDLGKAKMNDADVTTYWESAAGDNEAEITVNFGGDILINYVDLTPKKWSGSPIESLYRKICIRAKNPSGNWFNWACRTFEKSFEIAQFPKNNKPIEFRHEKYRWLMTNQIQIKFFLPEGFVARIADLDISQRHCPLGQVVIPSKTGSIIPNAFNTPNFCKNGSGGGTAAMGCGVGFTGSNGVCFDIQECKPKRIINTEGICKRMSCSKATGVPAARKLCKEQKNGDMWAPRNQADLKFLRDSNINEDIYIGIYWHTSKKKWLYHDTDEEYPQSLFGDNGGEKFASGKSDKACLKRKKKGDWVEDKCDHCHDFFCYSSDFGGATSCPDMQKKGQNNGQTITIEAGHKCPNDNQCRNKAGSYVCDQGDGFWWVDGQKTDKNECLHFMANMNCEQKCVNTNGSFKCECNSGFEVNGSGKCNDINECNATGAKKHKCGQNATCKNTSGSYTCSCKSGFTLNADGKTCKDINECAENTDNCHKNADCTNTSGSFTCKCKTGFSGNGVNCNDIDHCKNHDCGTGGTCVEKNNAATCVCDTGFELKNGKCVDINECNKKTDNCHKDATCTNTVGSFTCQCKSGFSGDGVNCNDIDHCKNVNCGPGGNCVEKNNAAMCVCDDGFELKNNKCVDINECSRGTHNCHNNADCINNSGSFSCKCKSGFSGNGVNCNDIDHCKNVDCGNGGRCIEENNAPVCKCDAGFELKNGKCKDVDECNKGTHDCNTRATCINNDGSFTCQCPSGFRNVNNGRNCDDINECSEKKHNCHKNANCINNEGSFTCKCKTGFSGDGINKCDEVDVCKSIDCGVHGNCVEKNGKGVCECDQGFELKNGQCVDINECQETGANKHKCNDSTCKNTIGSYVCICQSGTRLMADGKTCEDINECLEDTHNCHQNANCINTISSFNCQCKAGYNGDGVHKCDQTCSNIDCGDNSKCITQNGKSVCVCIDGFSMINSKCIDIDECADPLLNDCHINADCTNTIGSYQCKCKAGFTGDGKINCSQNDPCMTLQCPDNSDCKNGQCVCHEGFSGPSCTDINECEPNPVAVCGNHSTCHNYPGGFTCLCWPGYEEHESKLGCKDIDECARDLDDCGDHSYCTNVPGNYYCTCKTGFESVNDSDGAECDDINECKVGNHNCDANASCTNTVGSYTCACNMGFVGNGRDCIETKDTCNPGCGENAHCQEKLIGQGRWARNQSTCKCNAGYQGDALKGCVDTDECTANTDPCDKNEKCHNHDGGFKCKCAPGYERDSNGNCVNIDECSANNLNFCHSTKGLCFDYDGGYTCSCEVGYIGDGINCADIDECDKGTDVCSTNAKCTNTIGSYECTCNPGFSGNGYECIQDEEETCEPTCAENSFCNEDKTCVCLAGYEMVNDKCIDIDECKRIRSGIAPTDMKRSMTLRLSQQTCNDPNSECLNLDGSFVCPCKSGYRLVNGICVNIDECDEANHACSKNAICSDLEGLYTCKCKDGFIGDGVICNENPCDHCGEASCNANGHCQCPKGYIYKNKKCVDVNECEAVNSPCQANSACINTDGSFVCTCHFGYILQRGANICVDLDECKLGTHQCHKDAKCSNYAGGYNCSCKDGFKGNGLNCIDIDECELNMCGMNAICTNKIGSYECKCKDGYAPHPIGKDGTRIVCIPTVDPCSKGTHDCDSNAFCQQDAKDARGYVCKCKPGYGPLGDDQVGIPETKCFDVDECKTGLHNCSQVQECHNTIGSFVCLCPSGMEGDGLTCEDVNECELGIDQCSAHATCKNTIGSYQCICDKGFGGATCSDIDECALGYHQCHENAICHNNEGSYTCICREHFIGDGIHKCVPGEDCPKDDPACDYHECTFGDPHFLFHQGDNERICFNYDGTLEHPMLLIGDDTTGFYVTGKLEKAGKGSAFKEITIMTPGGVVAVFGKSGIKEYQNGMVVRSENGSHEHGFQSDDLIVQKMTGSNNWNVRVGSGIEIAIERRHHMTVSYKKLRGLSKTVRGVVGFFIHQSYKVQNRTGNHAELSIRDQIVDVQWAKMTKHVSCWRIPKAEVLSLLGIENVTPTKTLRRR